MPTIITTHSFIWDQPGAEGRTRAENLGDPVANPIFPLGPTVLPQTLDGNTGQQIWEKFIKINPQIFMVLCGHWHQGTTNADGEYSVIDNNDAGLPVYQFLADYQGYRNGGNGYLRLIRFYLDANKLEIATYSPTIDQYLANESPAPSPILSNFTINVDLRKRFADAAAALQPLFLKRPGLTPPPRRPLVRRAVR